MKYKLSTFPPSPPPRTREGLGTAIHLIHPGHQLQLELHVSSYAMELWSFQSITIVRDIIFFQMGRVVCDNQGHWDVNPEESKCIGGLVIIASNKHDGDDDDNGDLEIMLAVILTLIMPRRGHNT